MSSHKERKHGDQFFDVQGAAAADSPLRDDAKPTLQLLEPGGLGGRVGAVRCGGGVGIGINRQ